MRSIFSGTETLGILGGGQLGKMLLQAASRWDIRTAVLDHSTDSPCRFLCNDFQVGSLTDFDTVYRFGKSVDVLTLEIEHVNVDALEKLADEGLPVYPQPRVIRTIQNKVLQKGFYTEHGLPTLPYVAFQHKSEVQPDVFGFPVVYKSATGGFDGRGVQVVKSIDEWHSLPDGAGLLERFLPDMKELSVLVCRGNDGAIEAFPTVEMYFHPEANLVEFLFTPAAIDSVIEEQARDLAIRTANAFGITGLLAVEMFLDPAGNLYINECAPRPHNSGHHTIESNTTSQFEQHLRAILDLPLGDTSGFRPAVMLNVLGEAGFSGPVKYEGIHDVLSHAGVYVHIYGKKQTKPFRKMGHITVVADELESAIATARNIQTILRVIA